MRTIQIRSVCTYRLSQMCQLRYTDSTVAVNTCAACVTEHFLCIGLTPDGTTACLSVRVLASSEFYVSGVHVSVSSR